MSDSDTTGETPQPERRAAGQVRDEAARKRRLAAVFGDVLPETSSDECSLAWGEKERGGSEDWLRRQVPPHHG